MHSKLLFCFLCVSVQLNAQKHSLVHFQTDSSITIQIDEPVNLRADKPTKLIWYALPNGNTIPQTFGKILKAGDDWHFDIQHIGAQTAFIRATDPSVNYIVVYAANKLLSWPAWRRANTNADGQIKVLTEAIMEKYRQYNPKLILAGHSGGGSFIFGYLNAQPILPKMLDKIIFLDATYGYETEKHKEKLKNWLKNRENSLQVISYNDSVVVYNGKPLVSPTGGTWYRSKLMAQDLDLKHKEDAEMLKFSNNNTKITLLKNSEAKILHTVLVEKNGFIHTVFTGTKFVNRNYKFWGTRAYADLIND